MPFALVTGASQGLGLALSRALVDRGWHVVVDARDEQRLSRAYAGDEPVTVIPGDVSSAEHRDQLAEIVRGIAPLDLLVNNASRLGPSPLPPLADHPLDELGAIFDTNVVAPLGLVQAMMPLLATGGVIVNVSSDAAVEPYPGWGGYGSSKAALDHAGAVLAVENPSLHVYSFDPGDMRTDMHQRAFPGEDISDRPAPDEVVPALLALVWDRPASGRYRAKDLLPVGAGR
jgi:NAD(P)-dependent dehydrogenase (short-subunit alcohol dehydrogenase family)